MKKALLLPLMMLGTAAAAAAAAAPPSSSSDSVKAMTVDDLYTGGRFRDPFRPLAGAGASASSSQSGTYNPEEFSIHTLNLKGILKDASGAYAVLVQSHSGFSFILKSGQLFDYKNKRVPGVTGAIQPRQKTVVLMTPDRDVQTLRLGETEEDEQRKTQ